MKSRLPKLPNLLLHRVKLLALGLAFVGLVGAVLAQSAVSFVTLSWTASVAAGITNQTIYWGAASGTYTNSINVSASATTTTVSNLVQDATYFFAVTCTDNQGLISVKSAEVSTRILPPAPTGLRIISAGP